MSRSWSSLTARFWPKPAGAIGLGFCGDRIISIRSQRIGNGHEITHAAEARLPFKPFRSAPRPDDVQALAQAVQRLAAEIPQGHWPLQIALPDPAGLYEILEFDSIPAAARERSALARFRLEKEWPTAAQMECVVQELGKDGDRALMLAMAADRGWLGMLRNACRSAGYVPGIIDSAINHVFNRYHDQFGTVHDGALVTIESDSWTVLIFDPARRPRFFRSGWRESAGGDATDHAIIARDVERLVRAYVLSVPARKLEGVYVYADESDRLAFASQLDARMRTPCVRLDMIAGFTVAPHVSPGLLAPAILAAATPRT